MKKNKFILTFISLMLLGACSSEGSASNSITPNIPSTSTSNVDSVTSTKPDSLPLEAKVFIDTVHVWIDEELTLEHKSLIDSAYILYNSLTEESKNLPLVIEVKSKLDKVKEEFLIIYHEYLSQKYAEEAGYVFVEEVNKVKDVSLILKEDKEVIKQLNLMYENLSNDSKNLSFVITAKEKLDALNSKIEELENMSENEYVAYEFVARVNTLPSIEELTIDHIYLINEMKEQYENLDSSIKDNENVINAKAILDSLVVRIEELKIIKEHAEAFIDAVYRLPTFDKLKWKDSKQEEQIKACEDAYNALTKEEKAYPGVSSAYNELMATRNTFNSLKEPFDISKIDFSISLGSFNSAKNNYNLRVNFTSGKDPISVLTGYYKIPRDKLRDYVTVYLNLYYEAGAVKSSPLYRYDITEDYNLTIDDFVKTLQELRAQGNEKAISGKGYNFTINIVSKCDEYASSDYSGFSVGATINF